MSEFLGEEMCSGELGFVMIVTGLVAASCRRK